MESFKLSSSNNGDESTEETSSITKVIVTLLIMGGGGWFLFGGGLEEQASRDMDKIEDQVAADSVGSTICRNKVEIQSKSVSKQEW